MTNGHIRLICVLILCGLFAVVSLCQNERTVAKRAQQYYNSGDFDGCAKIISDFVGGTSTEPTKHYLMYGGADGRNLIWLEGDALVRLGRTREAIEPLTALSKIWFEHSENLGQLYYEDGQHFWAGVFGTLGRAHITLGQFSEAQSNCMYACDLDTGDVALIINRGHCFLQNGHLADAEEDYDKALSLIQDEKTFDTTLAFDFQMFIQKGWMKEESRYELNRLTSIFKKDPSVWNKNAPNSFQSYFNLGFDSLKAEYQDISKGPLQPIFHYLTAYRYFDYNNAASEDGKTNEFELRRLKAKNASNQKHTNALDTDIPNKIVLETYFNLPSSDYDFSTKSFRLNFRKLVSEALKFDISNYQPNPTLPRLYSVSAAGSFEFSNLPERLLLEVGNDDIAENWSKKDAKCRIYFKIAQQRIQEKQTNEVSMFFKEYMRKKGYNSLAKVPKGKLRVLENSFYRQTFQTPPYTRIYDYYLKALVKFIQIELPNQEVVTWIPG